MCAEATGYLEISSKDKERLLNEWVWAEDEIVYTDRWGRRWQLVPNNTENIIMPFIVKRLPKEG